MVTTPDFHQFDRIMVNTSGGKDSQTALRKVVTIAKQVEYPLQNIVVFHADLGRMEWKGVKDLAREQAQHYGLRFVVDSYKNKKEERLELLDYVRARRKWPSSTARFCTSEFKRSPGGRLLTQLHREIRRPTSTVLNVYGFRAEESPARAKRVPYEFNERRSTKLPAKKFPGHVQKPRKRTVYDWLPIHDWTEAQVWADIRESGVRHHQAYDLGMPRLSCCFCIFAPPPALMIAGKHNPELLDEYVALEAEIGHDFQHKKPIREIKAALDRGEEPSTEELHGAWNM